MWAPHEEHMVSDWNANIGWKFEPVVSMMIILVMVCIMVQVCWYYGTL